MTDQENEIFDMQDKALQSLTKIERQVIELRFGLIDRKFLTYYEVARKCGVSNQRIGQVVRKSIKKIRRYMYKNKVLTDTK